MYSMVESRERQSNLETKIDMLFYADLRVVMKLQCKVAFGPHMHTAVLMFHF
jgi:hypothetical protein